MDIVNTANIAPCGELFRCARRGKQASCHAILLLNFIRKQKLGANDNSEMLILI